MVGVTRDCCPARRSVARRLLYGLSAGTIAALLAACGSSSLTGASQAPALSPTPAVFGTPGSAGSATLLTYTGHGAGVISIAWSPDGARVASASGDDNTVSILDSVTGHTIQVYRGHISTVWTAAWSPDGMKIVSGDQIGIAQVWKAAVG
jgi:WD40 repeat protein